MSPSAVKVAREWNDAQIGREIRLFKDYVTAFWKAVRSDDRLVNYRWVDMINSGSKLAPWLVETRAVPRGLAKKFEMAIRLFLSSRRSPRNLASWVSRNEKNIAYFEQALDWPEKSSADEGGEEVFRLEGFTVHNTVQLEGGKLESTKLAITKAVKAIKGMGIPNAAGNIYGNLFIVGRLTSPRSLAWYAVNSDELYVRPHMRVGPGEIHALIHEIGHRYWFKLMQGTKKKFWTNYHWKILNTPRGSISMPKAGDPMPVPVRGHKTPPIILDDIGPSYTLEGGGLIKKRQLIKILQNEAQQAKFPTPYAATSDTEHFAEAFAMYALGTLSTAATEAFKTIVVNGEKYETGQVQKERAPPESPLKPATPPQSSRVPDRLPSGSSLLKMVQDLETMARQRRTKKVLKFVEGIVETLKDGGRLGPRREKRLTRILQSYGLLSGGTTAGRVATRWLEGDSWANT